MSIDTTVVYALLYMSLYFEVFLLISFIAHNKQHNKNNIKQQRKALLFSSELPSVTIIVPCYNEEKTLAGTLKSLLALDYPTNKLNICVVNDGSTDGTLAIAREFEHRSKASVLGNGASVMVLDKENGGKASAMNMALAQSNSELIGCLDADSFVEREALILIVKHFVNDSAVSAVTPAVMIHNPQNILQMMQRAEYMAGVFMRRVFSMIDSIIVTPGPFSIFRRANLLELAIEKNTVWLHAHGTEDFEMGLRLQSVHKKIANEPMAKVMTISPNTLYSLYRQRIRWMYGFLMNAWDYRYMIGNIKYGNIGILILPATIMSIFGGVYVFGLLLTNIISYAVDMLMRIYVVGFSFSIPKFNWFYINASALLFIVASLIILMLIILYYSAQISQTKVRKRDAVLYLLLYGLVAPLWLTGAVARVIVGKESKWKVIR
ncbi:MAG: glycosyltransferase family 2 protein [Candidatus Pacebacteria bacterium]|nr:glycosyltransferase family 2 protein [Candidatus Paceibacterota bacterium]